MITYCKLIIYNNFFKISKIFELLFTLNMKQTQTNSAFYKTSLSPSPNP